ncbi:hypothetical protein ACHAWF_007742, partial [Thalassiosira exigua]
EDAPGGRAGATSPSAPGVDAGGDGGGAEPIRPSDEADDDDFGDFDAFEAAPEAGAADDAAEEARGASGGSAARSAPALEGGGAEPGRPSDEADDDEFGDFGDFDAFEAAPGALASDDDTKEDVRYAPPGEGGGAEPSRPSDEADDDEFGDFGDFDAFEEAPAPPPDAAPESSGGRPVPPAAEGSVADPDGPPAEDDFGDFGGFDEGTSEEGRDGDRSRSGRGASAPAESAPGLSPSLSMLNPSVRVVFEEVFASNGPLPPDAESGTRSEFPFDFPMRNILPEQPPREAKHATESHRSERQLADLRKRFQSLARSQPLTILSDEKWYPYSHYEFGRDGSSRGADDAAERGVPSSGAHSSVPEVLSIDLPTGFEASSLSPSSRRRKEATSDAAAPPARPADRYAPTVVDFPSSPKSHGRSAESSDAVAKEGRHKSEESEGSDSSKLSEAGKRFLDQLPDLSYMLKSTLSLPNDKK